jgi:hypothetical protein
MCRESLRISVTNLHEAITPTEEKDRFKKFQEAEKKRYRAEQQRSWLCITFSGLKM